jgi:hypothetical protein
MPAKKIEVAEACDLDGAKELAGRIKRHWRERGYLGIRTWLTQISHYRDEVLYCVRSNIGHNGFPPLRAQA